MTSRQHAPRALRPLVAYLINPSRLNGRSLLKKKKENQKPKPARRPERTVISFIPRVVYVTQLCAQILANHQVLRPGDVLPQRLQAGAPPQPAAGMRRAEPVPPGRVQRAGAGRDGRRLGGRVRLQEVVERR